jgi:hypothetical protein
VIFILIRRDSSTRTLFMHDNAKVRETMKEVSDGKQRNYSLIDFDGNVAVYKEK